ncbi:hypothetical protein [Nocardia sp. 2TAF39]|uniref:hypothetical protein n=1 Tax=Nocardia sp. 2TAF39 TaxID=3233017 RepID=UPI003F9C6A59
MVVWASEVSGVGSGEPGGVAVGAGERERVWALAAAKAQGVSIREIANAAGLSSSWSIGSSPMPIFDALDAALGVLRAAGWPAPEDPDVEDGELAGRAEIAGSCIQQRI